jgi:NitT/TauT family transport system substrate-binding protein
MSIVSRCLQVIVALAAAICISGSSLAQTKIVVGLPVSNYGPLAPVYVARDLGFFGKNSVSAEIAAFRGGSAMQEALAAGSVDIIDNSAVGAGVAIGKGIKQKIVGAYVNRPIGWHLMVLSDSPVKSVKELEGKTVGVTATGSMTDFYLNFAIKQANAQQVKAIPVGGGGLVPSLKGKQVDAAVMFSPLPFELMLAKTARSIFDFGNMESSLPDVWIASQRLIVENPAAIDAVLRSIYQAVAYMKQNREQSFELLKKYTSLDFHGTIFA